MARVASCWLAEACKNPALDGLWIYGVTVFRIVYTPPVITRSRLAVGANLTPKPESPKGFWLVLSAEGQICEKPNKLPLENLPIG